MKLCFAQRSMELGCCKHPFEIPKFSSLSLARGDKERKTKTQNFPFTDLSANFAATELFFVAWLH